METIISNNLPELVWGLYHLFRKRVDQEQSQESAAQVVDRLSRELAPVDSLFNSISPAKGVHDECKALEVARDFAVSALHLYVAQMIHALKAHYNRISAIYRLPNEVLALIFRFTEGSRDNSLWPLRLRAPLNISRVSRLWRQIALSTPCLWTTIDVTNASIRSVFLERSRNALLSIDVLPGHDYRLDSEEDNCSLRTYQNGTTKAFRLRKPYFTLFIKSLVPFLPRWGSVKLRDIDIYEFPTFHHAPAPNLETFHVYAGGTAKEAQTPPLHLLRGETPRLRDLHLVATCVRLDSPIYANLTSLHLECIKFDESSVTRLLEIFAMCPFLDTLGLVKVRFSSPRGDVPPNTIPLKHLRRMKLVGIARGVEHLIIGSVILTPFLRLHLSPSIDRGLDIFPPGLRIGNSPPNIARIRRLTIRDNAQSFTVTGCAAPTETLLTFGFSTTSSYHASDLIDVLARLAEYVSFHSLESVTFTNLDERTISINQFSHMLLMFPKITILTLSSCSPSFMSALTIGPRSLHCLLLHVLHLHNMHISGVTVALVDSRIRARHWYKWGAIFPLDTLVLQQCFGEVRGRIPELRSLVDVIWEM
ncbi:hypothetical protein BOTBODRAFT_37814 [Botryobasidium botryosum FD-172 SS1]|uniref:F-box domain-containing protein n=1 Tax=Botryobasidium botryosum (strain FD-172 SS1) TaxID=930990 RepID=A0A067LZF5_BOTB1|nr:hypothetical protein BOTBODRAFT_37814 [Botryobasidium botryosum FD-172 SS1]